MELADAEEIDPDRISFLKVLKHVRRSIIGQTANTARKTRLFMNMLASKVRRKLDSGPRRLRESDRLLKRPDSKYSFRQKSQARRTTRRTTSKVIALHPVTAQ
ncbi:hypothetical protein IU459_28310 [Nocardia amamiensis]|uniref:Uncharacterized protein n=2 Tax=Nocardia amamiensis TaxID=404578 RepID=A0ABS0D081_9NOCA|nr:hypothetical protein [Nocardia amamiensis]